jgi:AraC-like DNA-binding protein
MRVLREIVPLLENQVFTIKTEASSEGYLTWHFHPEFEIFACSKGSGKIMFDNELISVSEGMLIFVPGDCPHCWIPDPGGTQANPSWSDTITQTVLHVNYPALRNMFAGFPDCQGINHFFENRHGPFAVTEPATALALGGLLEKTLKEKEFARLLSFLTLLQELKQACSTALGAGDGGTQLLQASARRNRTGQTLDTIVKYINANYQRDIRLKEVAALVNLEETYFCRYFKTHTQKSFFQYLNEFRIVKSCALIKTGKFPLKEIGYRTGFNNQSYFSKLFKEKTKKTPGQYAKLFGPG